MCIRDSDYLLLGLVGALPRRGGFRRYPPGRGSDDRHHDDRDGRHDGYRLGALALLAGGSLRFGEILVELLRHLTRVAHAGFHLLPGLAC